LSDPEFPLGRFHHIDDMRSSESLSRLKQDATGGVGFDVVLLQNSLHFFTNETRPILLKRLLTLLSPGGRIVIDWPLPSSSYLHVRGTKGPQESMCTLFGYQQILTLQGWNDLKDWKLKSKLNVKSTEVWVTKNEKKNAQKKLAESVAQAGGKVVRFDESQDRTGGSNHHLEQLKVRRAINNKPSNAGEGVQLNYEREQLTRELAKTEKFNEVQKVGESEFMNVLLDYCLHAVVKNAVED
jgi:SAM-dependent methyltransferase